MKILFIILAIINAILFFSDGYNLAKIILPLISVVLCLFYCWFPHRNNENVIFTSKHWFSNNKKILCFMVMYFVAFFSQTLKFSLWSEEVGWINIAIDILQGTRHEILIPKSDYPSSFQSWPMAIALYIFKDPIYASRLIGMFYFVLSLYFISGIGALFLYQNEKPVFPAIFFSLSTSPLLFVLTGWHEVTYIPALIFGMWYFLLSFLKNKSQSSLILFALFVGVSSWSLYMPCLVALILSILFILSRIDIKSKLNFVIYVAPLVSPFCAIILKRNMLQRHQFLLFDVERDIPTPNGRLIGWYDALIQIWNDMVRVDTYQNISYNLDYWGNISLGPVCTCLVVMFMLKIICKFDFKVFYWLLFPFIICICILCFTVPNFWREHFLYELLIIMSMYSLCKFIKYIKNNTYYNKYINVFIGLLLFVHILYFTYRYSMLCSFWPNVPHVTEFKPVINAKKLFPVISDKIENKNCDVSFPARDEFYYLKALLGNIKLGKFVQNYESDKDIIIVKCDNGEEMLSITQIVK